jgi:hypothetical protein
MAEVFERRSLTGEQKNTVNSGSIPRPPNTTQVEGLLEAEQRSLAKLIERAEAGIT